MAQQIQGLKIKVYIGKTVLGYQKNCTLSMESDTIDVSNKNSDGWSDFIAGTKSWSISCDGQFVVDEQGSQAALMTAFKNGDFVSIEMKSDDKTVYFKGNAIITSLELEASYDDVFAYSVEFNGKGALETEEETQEPEGE